MGNLHGGLSATIVDIVTTLACVSKTSHPGVSTDLNVTYDLPSCEIAALIASCDSLPLST